MEYIKFTGRTNYYTMKSCIESCIEYFYENKDKYFVKLICKSEVGREKVVVARREVISQYIGIDIVKYKEKDRNHSLIQFTRDEVYELWSILECNEVVINRKKKESWFKRLFKGWKF